MNLVNPIHGLQKSKKPKPKPETKNLLEFKYVFLVIFKVKKIHNLNPPHHMEPFDIKINRFGATNGSFLSLSRNLATLSLHLERTKNDGNEVWYQNIF